MRETIIPGKYKGYLIPVFSGLLLSLAYPTFNLGFLAFFCIVPFLLSLYGRDGKGGFFYGLSFGLPYFFVTQYWIYHSINQYGGVPFVVSITVVMGLCLYESLYTGLFGLIVSTMTSKRPVLLTAFAPFLWVGLEFLRGRLFTGFPWSLLGYTQEGFSTLVQVADITGIYGVSFLVILVNTALTDLVITHFMKKTDRRTALLSFTMVMLLFALSVAYGTQRIKEIKRITSSSRHIRVAIVQGNIDQSVKWDRRYQKEVIQRYFSLTKSSLREKPQLIVWPETALPFYPDLDKKLSKRLKSFIKEIDTPLLTGAILVRDRRVVKNRLYYSLTNSALLYDEDGNLLYVYDKIHLVPFGEYVPLKDLLFFINRLVEGIGDYKAGTSYKGAQLKWGAFSTIICYEAIFPGLVRKLVDASADLLINITNDAWFGKTTGPYQHFSISRFRAIENRVTLVRAANTGISGFIDAKGDVIKKLGLFRTGYIVANIPVVEIESFYKKYGDFFSYLCLLYIALALIKIRHKRGGIRS